MNGAAIKLTVIIIDKSPLIHLNESITRRSVSIDLTVEQIAKLTLKHLDEEISQCFLEAK